MVRFRVKARDADVEILTVIQQLYFSSLSRPFTFVWVPLPYLADRCGGTPGRFVQFAVDGYWRHRPRDDRVLCLIWCALGRQLWRVRRREPQRGSEQYQHVGKTRTRSWLRPRFVRIHASVHHRIRRRVTKISSSSPEPTGSPRHPPWTRSIANPALMIDRRRRCSLQKRRVESLRSCSPLCHHRNIKSGLGRGRRRAVDPSHSL